MRFDGSDPEFVVEDILKSHLSYQNDDLERLDKDVERLEGELSELRLHRLQILVRIEVIKKELENHEAHK